jgi:flagellar motor switch protein FliM
MSDGELSKDEIDALLASSPSYLGKDPGAVPLSQREVDALMTLIDPGYTGSSGVPLSRDEINLVLKRLENADAKKGGPRTQILTQEEINQLLAALDASESYAPDPNIGANCKLLKQGLEPVQKGIPTF